MGRAFICLSASLRVDLEEVLDGLLFWAWRVGGSPQCVLSLGVTALSVSTLERTSGECSLQ